jgi:hypothetical protein
MFALLLGNERFDWSRPISEVARVSPVKPLAQPTLVRTQHLPPPAKTARDRGFSGLEGCCVSRDGVPRDPCESGCFRLSTDI